MRKAVKVLHTLAACGLIGALAGYALVLLYARQDTPAQYADMRHTINIISNYLLMPSLGVGLLSGLVSMIVHQPFQQFRWAWLKALLGISMFEATLVVISTKANTAAALADKITAGENKADELAAAIASEWNGLAVVFALAMANILLGIWRPSLMRRSELID